MRWRRATWPARCLHEKCLPPAAGLPILPATGRSAPIHPRSSFTGAVSRRLLPTRDLGLAPAPVLRSSIQNVTFSLPTVPIERGEYRAGNRVSGTKEAGRGRREGASMQRIIGPIILLASLLLVGSGCGNRINPLLLPNQPPEVELFAQREDASASGPFAYRLQWAGHDPDGRIDHYLFALGSPAADARATPWTSTLDRAQALSFPARVPAPARASLEAPAPSVFSVVAVDGVGARSEPARVAFFDGELAPRVEIISPRASALVRYYLPTTVCLEWRGTAFDDDSTGARASRIVE